MIGKTISHYRVVSQLGSGGMGVVYAAEDVRLSREVALKFVSTEAAQDVNTIDRLKAEARTTSALNHPNICTIYDIGEHDGHPFIVMEMLKGRTLRERLAAGPLKIHETLDIGIQVTDALVAAHSRGIIHRDIKPPNIFLVDQGPVKVLDFGLAKSISPLASSEATISPTADLTVAGTTVGTISYMSPEQVGGDPLDRRTDLFSLGVVLYECVTGQQPFQGKTSAVVLASILHQQPTPPTTLNATLPPVVQDVISKCLEKDPEFRYQDAEGLRADLKRIRRDLESGALRTGRSDSVAALTAEAVRRESSAAPIASERADSGVKSASIAQSPSRNWLPLAAMGVAALAIAASVVFVMSRRPATPADTAPAGTPAQTAAASPDTTPELKLGSANAAPAGTAPPPASASRPVSPRFDAAIVDANRLLAAGDADGATRALNIARSIDPASPAVADLSARLVEVYRSAAARRPASAPPSPAASRAPAPAPASPPSSAPPPALPPPTPAPARAPEPAPSPVQASLPPAAPRPAETSAVTPLPGATLPSRPEPVDRRPAPAPTPAPSSPTGAEDEDAAIRRVVATYGRAIETKDLALYRSVKPNLSAAEQRTIEDGFRAVTSQRVTINIQSIEHRGQEAVVRLRRQDVIQAGGRQQTAESQQSLTLVRGANGWVIREIGR